MLSSLLILLPLALLLIAAAGLLLLHRYVPSFGFAWLVAAAASLFAWVITLILRTRIPLSLDLLGWQPASMFTATPSLSLDPVSWQYSAGLVTLAFAIILTATARYQFWTSAATWAGSLSLTALGLVAVMSANPLTLILTWTALDLIEFLIQLTNLPDRSLSARPVIGFAARAAGTFIVYWAMTVNGFGAGSSGAFAVSRTAGLYFLLGVGLRLGIFPLHLTFPQELPIRRGLGNMLRLTTAVSSLVVLARLPAGTLLTPLTPVLLGFAALASFYASLQWATTSDELNGRPYWIIAISAIILACVIRGDPIVSVTWGAVLLLSGGILFLYSARDPRLNFLPILGIWGMSGLPYSPTGSAFSGLTSGPLPGLNVIFLASHALLVFGYARHAFRQADPLSSMERWVYLTYPGGLLLMAFVQNGLGLRTRINSYQLPDLWWIGPLFTAVGVAGYIFSQKVVHRLNRDDDEGFQQRWIDPLAQRLLSTFTYIFRLEWLYRLAWTGYRGLGNVVADLTTILEGDGGVLWVFVLLALLLTLLRAGGNP